MSIEAKKPTGAEDKPKRKVQRAQAEAVTLRGLLGEVIAGQKVIADRLESIRRTLWRMSDVRNYKGKDGKGAEVTAPEAGTESPKHVEAQAGEKKVGE